MKLEVNGIVYDIGIMQHKVKINNREMDMIANMNEEKIMINGKTYHLDFEEEGEPSLMIINGMTYLVSKSSVSHISVRELKAPISGKVVDILTTKGIAIKEGQVLIILEAMKMEIQIKSPVSKEIREIKVSKGQSVKTGDVLIIFE
ncbi:MAG: acetyl-CoA carboxylase biotin carboxyl carrier protein subunit [Nitrososphaeraceae archaeon]